MHLYIISRIILIVLIVDCALAAPVLVQGKRQACADMTDIPEYTVTVLPKRGRIWGEIEEVGGEYIENYFVLPKEAKSPAVHGSAPLEPGHASSSAAPPEPGHVSMSAMDAPAPKPGPSTESNHLLASMDAPLSTPVHPTWFHPDNQLLGSHAPPPNTGPSNPSTELNSEHRLVAEQQPLPTKGSSTDSGLEMVAVPPSGRTLSTDPDRESMSAYPPLESLQTDSDASKELRRNSATARDVGNVAQSELQPERSESLDPEA